MEAFNIREGGLAIHGGLIFGLVTAWMVCQKKNIPFLSMADLILPGVALAQCIGRWGNFFNSEAYGRPYVFVRVCLVRTSVPVPSLCG